MDNQSTPSRTDTVITRIGTLELREELPLLNKEKIQSGQVTFRRELRTRTETVALELHRETLVIEVHPGEAGVVLDGESLQPGETREVLLYDERAMVAKQMYITEEVQIGKRTVTEVHEESIDLHYEVLVTERNGPDPVAQGPA